MMDSAMRKIKLRAMEPEDLDVLYKIENDRKLWDVGITNVPYSRYVLHDYIANSSGDIYTDKQLRLIVENEHGDVVGLIDIADFDPQHLRAELGIVIQRQYRKRGYATSAVCELMRYAREIIHLHQLYIYVDIENADSIEIFKKVGFVCSAVLKDWLYVGDKYRDALLMQYFL